MANSWDVLGKKKMKISRSTGTKGLKGTNGKLFAVF